MANDAITTIETALRKGFAAKEAEVYAVAQKSDYKDFIRLYVVSDYFRGMAEKERLDAIYSMLQSFGAGSLIERISLCIGMTTKEHLEQFEGGEEDGFVFVRDSVKLYRELKPQPKLRRLAESRNRARG